MPDDTSRINTEQSQQTNDNDGDKANLTDMASRLKSLESKLETQPAIDQSKVNKVRDAISRGEYRVNPERVADKMIDFDADFDS